MRRTRGLLAVVGGFLSCALLLTGTLGVWAQRSFLDTEVFSQRAGSLIDHAEVTDALATYLTAQAEELFDAEDVLTRFLPDRATPLAGPLARALDALVDDQVDAFVRTGRFADLWRHAVREAHAAAVRVLEGDSELVTAGDEITIDFVPVIDAMLAVVGEQTVEVLGRTFELPTLTVDDFPIEDREGFARFTVYDEGALSTAQDGLELANDVVWVLVVLTPILVLATVLVAVRRRRTIVALGAGAVVAMIALRVGVGRLELELLDLVQSNDRPAVTVVADTFLRPLRRGTDVVAVIALLVGLVALLSGLVGRGPARSPGAG